MPEETKLATRSVMDIERDLVTVLKMIHDPEIPANIYDLGLIYEVDVNDDCQVSIVMTLTAPNCPMADELVADVQQSVESIEGVTGAKVELTFDPPWTEARMSDEARFQMGLL